MNQLREQLAALEHEQWAHWTRYLLANLTPANVDRWRRQCETPYAQLTEAEKDKDREWADRVLAIANPLMLRRESEPTAEGETRPVLLSAGVIVSAPTDEGAMYDRIGYLSDHIRLAVASFAANIPDVIATGVVDYHYLTDPGTNAFRCASCGCWATDHTLSDEVPALPLGCKHGTDEFLCEQCWERDNPTQLPPDPSPCG